MKYIFSVCNTLIVKKFNPNLQIESFMQDNKHNQWKNKVKLFVLFEVRFTVSTGYILFVEYRCSSWFIQIIEPIFLILNINIVPFLRIV